jgi:hypothetical protein
MISPHIVFILGAGASTESGIPVMQNFLDCTDKIIQNLSYFDRLDDELNESYKDIIETRKVLNQIYHKSNIDLDNIEHLYCALVMASTFGSLGKWNVRIINKKIKNLEYIIIRTIEESMILGTNNYIPEYPKPYNYFLDLIIELQYKYPTTDISVITFNYDLAFEISHMIKTKETKNIRNYNYCLDGKSRNYETIKLLKLHGSLNWADMGNNELKYFDVNNYHKSTVTLIKQDHMKVNTYPIGSCLQEEKGFESLHRIAIIPPSFNKDFRYKSLKNVWREAAKQLSMADNIYISGFSLSNADNFFRYLYSIGTISNVNLKSIDVYNYHLNDKQYKDTNDRYLKLIGNGIINRFKYYNKKFSEMIVSILGSPKPTIKWL